MNPFCNLLKICSEFNIAKMGGWFLLWKTEKYERKLGKREIQEAGFTPD